MTHYKAIFTNLFLVAFSTSVLATTDNQAQANAGIDVYERACKTCHAPTVAKAMGAPQAFNKAAWQERLHKAAVEAKKDPKQYPSAGAYLLYQVKIGRGLMHHGGLCKELENMDCSDKAILEAIAYISTEQKK